MGREKYSDIELNSNLGTRDSPLPSAVRTWLVITARTFSLPSVKEHLSLPSTFCTLTMDKWERGAENAPDAFKCERLTPPCTSTCIVMVCICIVWIPCEWRIRLPGSFGFDSKTS